MKGGAVMKENNTNNNILLYFLKMVMIFISIDLVISILPSFITSSILGYKYGSEIILELFYALFAIIVMLLFHNSYVFTNKHTKFGKAIKYGIPMLIYSGIYFVVNVIGLKNVIVGNLINIIILCIFIGFAEEFLCRGWLQNEFLERFGDSKKGVVKSILCSSLVFGCMHLINVVTTSQGLVFTLLQVLNAITLGFYLGVIYYKSKNIWSVIFLHAFYDFALFLGEVNLVKDCTVGTLSNDVILANFISIALLSLFWVLSSAYVLKKSNFPDVKASRSKKGNALLLTGVVVFGLLSFIPFENYAEGYDKAYVCYDYEITNIPENHVLHFPYYDTYNMVYEREVTEHVMSDENPNDVKEVIVLNKYNISIWLDTFGTMHIKNNNTGYEKKYEVGISNLEVIENTDAFTILFSKDELESTVYYSDYVIKNNMTNDDEFIDEIVESFLSYDLPLIYELGYLTIEDSEYKYPVFYSENYDYFIIKNGDLYLIK